MQLVDGTKLKFLLILFRNWNNFFFPGIQFNANHNVIGMNDKVLLVLRPGRFTTAERAPGFLLDRRLGEP